MSRACPAWSAPIVGTRPTFPMPRRSASEARTSSMVWTTRNGIGCPACRSGLASRGRARHFREAAGAHVFDVVTRGARDVVYEVDVLLGKRRDLAGEEPEHVGAHQHLAVAARA